LFVQPLHPVVLHCTINQSSIVWLLTVKIERKNDTDDGDESHHLDCYVLVTRRLHQPLQYPSNQQQPSSGPARSRMLSYADNTAAKAAGNRGCKPNTCCGVYCSIMLQLMPVFQHSSALFVVHKTSAAGVR